MTMPHTPDYRARRIAKALDSVKAAHNARSLFDSLDDGSRLKTDENDNVTQELLEDAVRAAMGYGFPIEAVAVAASMSEAEIHAIADGSAAA